MRRVAWLFVLLPACGSSPAASPATAAKPAAPPPIARAARLDEAACAEARRATEATTAATCSPPKVVGRCDPSGWITRLDAVEDGNQSRETPDATMPCLFRWTLAHVMVGAPRAELELAAASRFGLASFPVELRFADVDGDGEVDAIVTTRTEGPYGESPHTTHSVYRRVGRGIEAWKPPRGVEITEVVDVDRDGRLDLRYGALPYQLPSETGQPTDLFGVTLVAHGTPAGFAFDDDVARGAAAAHCSPAPRAPRADTTTPLSAPELEETMRYVACAKLSGTTEAAIVDSLDRRCASYDGDTRGGDAAGVCPRFFLDWASAKAPRLLGPRR